MKYDDTERPRGPKAPRALPVTKGGVKMRNRAHGLEADVDPRDVDLAISIGWERV